MRRTCPQILRKIPPPNVSVWLRRCIEKQPPLLNENHLSGSLRPILLKNSKISCGEFFSETAKIEKYMFNIDSPALCDL
jgi:hypothetical protein